MQVFRNLFGWLCAAGNLSKWNRDARAALMLLLTAAPFSAGLYGQPWITGYYSAQNGNLPISQIPWAKYTHVIHFAASTDGQGNVILYYLTQDEINLLTRSNPPGTKVLVAIKDNDNNLNAFPQSTAPRVIGAFVTNIANFVISNGYDGVDIDWEKNLGAQNAQNIAQFNDLLARLRAAMPDKIITMAANPDNASVAVASNSYLDQVNVMCYDFDWDSSVSWYVGALRNGTDAHPGCDWDIRHFTQPDANGSYVPQSKIGLGMPYYGRRWPHVTQALQNSTFNTTTTFYYRDLVSDTTRWQPQYRVYDNLYGANYLSINRPSLKEFDSYTGPEFVNDAVSWQQTQGLGGFMTFTIEYEHLSDQACDAAFPLSTELYNGANPNSAGSVLTVLKSTAGDTQVSLSWSSCSGEASYNVYRSTSSEGPYDTLATGFTGTSYTDTTVVNDTPYYYFVAAVSTAGLASGNSNQVSATPTASSPCCLSRRRT